MGLIFLISFNLLLFEHLAYIKYKSGHYEVHPGGLSRRHDQGALCQGVAWWPSRVPGTNIQGSHQKDVAQTETME